MKKAVFYQYPIIIGVAIVAFVTMIIWPMSAIAQTGCVGDPCVFFTPTVTGTPSPLPTVGSGTPELYGMPTPVPFPIPHYGKPTSIPAFEFGDIPDPIDPVLSPITGALTFATIEPPAGYTSVVVLSDISTTLNLSYAAPSSFSGVGTSTFTSSQIYSTFNGIIGAGQGVISSVVSYTTYISGEINRLQYTETITITTAPTWYAPFMPREFANVGWTFEQMDDRMYSVSRISINSWATLFGYMSALPFRLIKNLWELFRFLGPFGLFLIWLLAVMLPAVFGIRLLVFLKGLIVRIFNFILTVIEFLLSLWRALPFI